jgi:hypothetical protein
MVYRQSEDLVVMLAGSSTSGVSFGVTRVEGQ